MIEVILREQVIDDILGHNYQDGDEGILSWIKRIQSHQVDFSK